MIKLENLTKDQHKIVTAYSFAGLDWPTAVNDLINLGLAKEDAEDVINKTGILGWM